MTYLLQREYQGNGEGVCQCVNQVTGESYAGDVAQIFPILAYSQTEVIKITEDESAQLRLVDSLIDPRPYQKAIDQVQEQLDENDGFIAAALEAQVKVEEARQEIATLEERITNIEGVLSSPLLSLMREAEAKRSFFEGQLAYLESLMNAQERYAEEVAVLEPPSPADELSQDPVVERLHARSLSAQRSFLKSLESAANQISKASTAIANAQKAWMPQFEAVRQQYEEELQGSNQAKLEADRRSLAKRKGKMVRDLEKCRKQAEGLSKLEDRRRQLLDRLDEAYQAYYEARKEKFDRLTQASDGRLQLTLTHATSLSGYCDAVIQSLKGSGPGGVSTANRQRIAQSLSPRELGDIIIARDVDRLAEASGLTSDMATRVMGKLWAADDFGEVLALQHRFYPDDTPSIRFNKGNDQYAELSELSVGQKCTALLIVALCDGEMPVIIDQPEDALDIASVWEDVAKKLRRGKYSRQFILTTHNSSLAVGSDSDVFMVLTPQSGERAKVSCRGAIDRGDVRRAVIDHLEGGDEPYKLRQRKYNIK